jgi:hypothetical protein
MHARPASLATRASTDTVATGERWDTRLQTSRSSLGVLP